MNSLWENKKYFLYIDDFRRCLYRSGMTINEFALACGVDESPAYFTYENNTMLIIQSKNHAKSGVNDFNYIEPFIGALISHESIHVTLKKLEGANISDSLDDIEVIIERHGAKFQISLNNMLFAKDTSGIVLS